jgi:foldase protein PrsA
MYNLIKWKNRTYRKVFAIAIVVLLVGGMLLSATYGLVDLIGRGNASPESPGETVAVVNGVEISKGELETLFNHAKNNLLQQGMELDSKEAEELLEQLKKQILQQMINNILLLQKSEEEGITPDEEEVQARYDEILAQYKDEKALNLKEQLSYSNLTIDILKKEIANNLKIEKYIEHYLAENVDEKDLIVTDEELKELYEQYSLQKEDLPEFEEMKPELLETLKEQKRSSQLELLIEKLNEDSEIEIKLTE